MLLNERQLNGGPSFGHIISSSICVPFFAATFASRAEKSTDRRTSNISATGSHGMEDRDLKLAACLCFTTLLLLETGASAQIRLSERNVLQRLPYEPCSLSLTGGQYIEVPASESLNIKGPFTVEAWIKPTTQNDQGIVERFNPNSPKNSEGGYGLRLTGGRLYFFVNKKQSEVETVQGMTTVASNEWHHVAGVFDGARMCVFLDGKKDDCKAVNIKPGKSKASFLIGARSDNAAQTFNGLIHKARVSAGALYTDDFEREELLMGAANARGYWRFDSQALADSSGNRNHASLKGPGAKLFNNDFPPLSFRLRPGDVIVIRRWRPGFERRNNPGDVHGHGPDSTVERIPLRLVKEPVRFVGEPARDEPPEKLYPYERQLLADILTVNRTVTFNTGPASQIRALLPILKANEVKLWNILIDSLRVKVLSRAGNVNSSYLTLKVLTKGLTDTLTAAGAPADFFRSYPNAAPPVEYELAALDSSYNSAWNAILGNDTNSLSKNQAFYADAENGSEAMFNFITVEFNGVALQHLQTPENQWSLSDFEESQICSSINAEKVQIDRITLAENHETYRILRDDRTPSHVVDNVFRNGRAVRIVTRVYNTDGYDHRYLSYSDLQKLYLEDISKIQWVLAGGGASSQQSQPALTLPYNCQLR